MTYELGKQLKDSGFPLKIIVVCDNKDEKHPYCNVDRTDCKPKIFNPPVLSELIEACGDRFRRLETYTDSTWVALAHNDESIVNGLGKTPEEAVAKLWLLLNPSNGIQ